MVITLEEIEERFKSENGYIVVPLCSTAYVLVAHHSGPMGIINAGTGLGALISPDGVVENVIYVIGGEPICLEDAPLKAYLDYIELKKIAKEIGLLCDL